MKHTLSVLVEDRPGALTRITTMFARRGFNIESLAVGPTERPGVSCITLRVDCAQHSLEQIEKQIHKLVNVLRVTELVAGRGGRAGAARRPRVGGARAARGARHHGRGARRPRCSTSAPTPSCSSSPARRRSSTRSTSSAVRYGILDLVRTGRIGVPRASARRRAARRLAAIN